MRLLLVVTILLSLTLIVFSVSYIFIHNISDRILSLIVLILLSVFALFEIVLTLRKIHSQLAIEKLAFFEYERVNPITSLACFLVAIIGLGFSIPGLVIFISKSDLTVRSYSLVILSIGTYILLHCIYFIIFVLSFKKQSKNLN